MACPESDVPAARKVMCFPSRFARRTMSTTSGTPTGVSTSSGTRR